MRPRSEAVRASVRQTEAVILFSVGRNAFAITAAAVHEIRNTDGLAAIEPSAAASAKVTHTFRRDKKTYCVVDGAGHFAISPAKPTRLLLLRNSNVGVLVGQIERMAEVGVVHPLPQAFLGKEREWYRGLVVLGEGAAEQVVPMVEPASFLSRKEVESVLSAAGAEDR